MGRWPKALALLLSCRKQLPLPRMPVSTLTRPQATMRSAHSSPFPTRVKPRTQSQPSRVGIIPLHSKRRHFTRGAAPSAKSTTLATSAMASLECVAASSSGASSNVAPQHMPVVVDTTVVLQSYVLQSCAHLPGWSILVGFRVLSAGLITSDFSATSTAECIAAMTMATSSSAPQGRSGRSDAKSRWHSSCTDALPFVLRGEHKKPHDDFVESRHDRQCKKKKKKKKKYPALIPLLKKKKKKKKS